MSFSRKKGFPRCFLSIWGLLYVFYPIFRAMDEQLALLVSVSCLDLETCRVALTRAGGDLNLAAQRLTSGEGTGTRGRCAECGAEGEGDHGEGGGLETMFQWTGFHGKI